MKIDSACRVSSEHSHSDIAFADNRRDLRKRHIEPSPALGVSVARRDQAAPCWSRLAPHVDVTPELKRSADGLQDRVAGV